MSGRHTITSKAGLAEVRRAIRADLRQAQAEAALAFDCLVAVTEACTNALLHGRDREEAPHPTLAWDVDRGTATFCVQDYSTEQWSRAMHPSRDAESDDLEERVGGFGLQLMRGLMDDVAIERGPAGTTVTLTKKLRTSALKP